MTDIQLKVRGDSSSGQQAMAQMATATASTDLALRDVVETLSRMEKLMRDGSKATGDSADEIAKATVKWEMYADIVKKASGALWDFAKDSVKAWVEAERVQKQLDRAAGEFGDALGQQADALERVYNVDGDVIKQSEMLLTQWGGVGAASKEVTEAVLNYAAATGQDAVRATEDLIRNVESGGTGLAKMGVHFETTGRRADDLRAATEALSKKFGGAAGADADSLHGQLEGLSIAFGNIKEDVGQQITKFAEYTGAVSMLTNGLRNLREFFSQDETNKLFNEGLRAKQWVQAQAELADATEQLNSAMMEGQSDTVLRLFEEDLRIAQAKVDALKASAAPVLGTVKVGDDPTNKGRKDREAAAKKEAEELAKIEEEGFQLAEMLRQQTEEWEKNHAAVVGSADGFKSYLDLTKQTHQAIKDATPSWNAWYAAWEKSNAKAMEKSRDKMAEWRAQMAEDNARAEQAEMKQWGQMGDQIGAAFVNGLASQIEKLSSGGEIDVALMVGDILASVIGIAATAIGTAFNAPQLGAAIGNLAAIGIRAGASAVSKGNLAKNRVKKYHDGGWVGPDGEYGHLPRYHSGAWIGADEQRAILQTGERVLSRREVGAMGGPAGVDAAARGGGRGVTIFMQAIDSKNASESLQTDLGKGMRTALRTGRGDLPLLFAGTKGPR